MNAPAPDPPIDALVGAVRPEWSAVDVVWAEVTRVRADIHLLRQAGKDPRSFLVEAFTIAWHAGLLREFVTGLVGRDLVDHEHAAALNGALTTLLGRSPFELQRFTNARFPPVNARQAFEGAQHALDLVCRININGQQVGTGVLVRPSLIATAAHVIMELATRQPDGTLRANEDSGRQLTVTFGDFDRLAVPGAAAATGTTAELHTDWLAWGSPPTLIEEMPVLAEVRDIVGIAAPEGPWDVALLRLAAARRPTPPQLAADPPPTPAWVHLLHHPHGTQQQGEPLLWSTGSLDEVLGRPPVRYLHDANTLGGSSGAPVFDREWRIVALHQGGARCLQRAADSATLPATARNRAVPVQYWSDKIDAVRPVDDTPYVQHLLDAPAEVPYPYPVIGRRDTQRRLWRGLPDGAEAPDRLLIVRGRPGTGLRFTKRLVRAMVEGSGGVVGALDLANAAGDDAVAFAGRIMGALSVAAPGRPDAAGLTTGTHEIRQQIVPALYRTWEELAARRPVWLMLETGERIARPLADLVSGLLRKLAEYPLLRLVLVGWVDAPPPGFESSVEELAPPTALDIAYRFTPAGGEPTLEQIAAAERVLAAAGTGGYPALVMLATAVRQLMAADAAAGLVL
jgi:hypothetical protein